MIDTGSAKLAKNFVRVSKGMKCGQWGGGLRRRVARTDNRTFERVLLRVSYRRHGPIGKHDTLFSTVVSIWAIPWGQHYMDKVGTGGAKGAETS